MPQDVRDLAAFYKTPLGQLAGRAIAREIHTLWPDLRNYRVLGYGFAIPYLHNGEPHDFEPDFIVRLSGPADRYLIIETKGHDPLAEVKHLHRAISIDQHRDKLKQMFLA